MFTWFLLLCSFKSLYPFRPFLRLEWKFVQGRYLKVYLPRLLAIVPKAFVVVRRLLPRRENPCACCLACCSSFFVELSLLVSTCVSLHVTDWNSLHWGRRVDEGSRLELPLLLVNGHVLLGILSRDDDNANENGTSKLHSHFLNKFAMISTHLICVMWLNYPGANVEGAPLKFRKRKEN